MIGKLIHLPLKITAERKYREKMKKILNRFGVTVTIYSHAYQIHLFSYK